MILLSAVSALPSTYIWVRACPCARGIAYLESQKYSNIDCLVFVYFIYVQYFFTLPVVHLLLGCRQAIHKNDKIFYICFYFIVWNSALFSTASKTSFHTPVKNHIIIIFSNRLAIYRVQTLGKPVQSCVCWVGLCAHVHKCSYLQSQESYT